MSLNSMPQVDNEQWLGEELAKFQRSQALLESTSSALYARWTSWSPTVTAYSNGSGGTSKYQYRQIGEEMFCRVDIRFGSGGGVNNSDPRFTLPKPTLSGQAPYTFLGMGSMWLASVGSNFPVAFVTYNTSTTQVVMYGWHAATEGFVTLNTGVPAAWGSGSSLNCNFSYLVTASY